MRNTLFTLTFLFGIIFFGKAESTVEYHFQEGFETSSPMPTGWKRTCAQTTSVNYTGNTFSGACSMKFDGTYNGKDKYLLSPQVKGAGSLSFYISKNARDTNMDLYVGVIIGTDTTIVKEYDAYNAPTKPNFEKVTVPINEANANLKIIFYSIQRSDNAAWFVIDDIELTKYTSSGGEEPGENIVEKINTDFNDGTWGTPLSANPASGQYPTSTINGFKLNNAALITGSVTCPGGDKHTNRILLDKDTKGGALEFPSLKDVGEVEIHAATGSPDMSFRLEEYISGNWTVIDTYKTIKGDSIYTIVLDRNAETKLRIANNTGSGLYIYKIATRTYQESIELNVTASNPGEGDVCYYNLTKTISLTFNKEVDFGTGSISLNGVQIPVASCTIDKNKVMIPVTLESTTSGKQYSLVIPQGAFVVKGNPITLSNAKTIQFSTYKTVAYPAGYVSQIDVIYSQANEAQNRMDIYYPASVSKPVPIVINIHGGGWASGEKESQGGFNIYFNDLGFAVANLEYRMTSHAVAPAAVEDVRCAIMYLAKHAAELNIDPNKIVIQGGSAGGHLALTGGYLGNIDTYDTSCGCYPVDFKVIAVIDKYGPSDLMVFREQYAPCQRWLGDKVNDDAFVQSISPTYLVNADTPPTYIIHGDVDPTVSYEQSRLLEAKLIEYDIKYQFTTVPGGGHGGFSAEYNTQMNNEIVAFLKDILQEKISTELTPASNNEKIQLQLSGNMLNINSDKDCQTLIYDNCGKLIYTGKEKKIFLSQQGFFIVKIMTESQIYTTKIVKK